MANRKYSDELKEQVVKEYREIGNVALVARRHDISKNTVKNRLKKVSIENDQLKKLLAEKELEIAILRVLRDSVNPR